MKSALQALTLSGIVCLVSEHAYATPNCSACGILRGAPGPEIGDGVVGFGVAAAVLLALLLLPRIKGLIQSKIA